MFIGLDGCINLTFIDIIVIGGQLEVTEVAEHDTVLRFNNNAKRNFKPFCDEDTVNIIKVGYFFCYSLLLLYSMRI